MTVAGLADAPATGAVRRLTTAPVPGLPAAPGKPDRGLRACTTAGNRTKAAQDRFLDEADMATVAGAVFGTCGESYLRFSCANSTENILEAIAEFRKRV